MKFRNRQLKYLRPDSNNMLTIISGHNCEPTFESLISFGKAVIHIREGSAIIHNRTTLIKPIGRGQMANIAKKRDKYKCYFCNGYGNRIDKVLKSGCYTLSNLVCCCTKCKDERKG